MASAHTRGALLSRRTLAAAAGAGIFVAGFPVRVAAQTPGWKTDRIELLQAQLRSHQHLRAFLMERDGAEPLAYYRADTTPSMRLNVASVTKSVVALLVGIAIDRGAIANVDEPLAAFFPEHANGAAAERLRRVTLRHMLTMSSGFEHRGLDANTDYSDFAQRLYSPGLLAHALGRRLADEPGSRFYYSNIDSQLVALALARRLKLPLADFARDELFRPLGIQQFEWAAGQDGVPDGAAGLRLAAPDLMRIGRMACDGGRFEGRQVVPQAFLHDATSRQVASDVPPRGRKDLWGYGWLWWTGSTPGDDLPAFSAAGYGGQYIHVVPALRLVVIAATQHVSREMAGRTAALIREFALSTVPR